jgi:hypothetical protein
MVVARHVKKNMRRIHPDIDPAGAPDRSTIMAQQSSLRERIRDEGAFTESCSSVRVAIGVLQGGVYTQPRLFTGIGAHALL